MNFQSIILAQGRWISNEPSEFNRLSTWNRKRFEEETSLIHSIIFNACSVDIEILLLRKRYIPVATELRANWSFGIDRAAGVVAGLVPVTYQCSPQPHQAVHICYIARKQMDWNILISPKLKVTYWWLSHAFFHFVQSIGLHGPSGPILHNS